MGIASKRGERDDTDDEGLALAPPDPARPAAGEGARAPGFRLVRPLGHGGMADVWHAVWRGRPVALKRMRPFLAEVSQAVRLFEREGQLALRLSHPNIVRAVEAGRTASEPFLALELIEGVDLHDLANQATAPLPLGFCAFAARELCAALDYAHRLADDEGRWLELVHRDVTPSNVMVGRDGSVKLCDFGLARARDADGPHTGKGVVKGKLAYVAPEVLAGEPYDRRADLFSLGVILHELCTGERLFDARSEREILQQRRAGFVPAPSAVNPRVSALFDHLVLRALERDPARRYGWATELASHLERALERWPWTREDTARLVAAHLERTGAFPSALPSSTVQTLSSVSLDDCLRDEDALGSDAPLEPTTPRPLVSPAELGTVIRALPAARPRILPWLVLLGGFLVPLFVIALSHGSADPAALASPAVERGRAPASAVERGRAPAVTVERARPPASAVERARVPASAVERARVPQMTVEPALPARAPAAAAPRPPAATRPRRKRPLPLLHLDRQHLFDPFALPEGSSP